MNCPYCHHDRIVHVHGHGQCARCGINIEPCCDGGGCEFLSELTDRLASQEKSDRFEDSRDSSQP